ncbi:MAG: phospholipase [Clostridia bacterium]
MKKSWKRPPCLYGNWCGPGCSGPDSPIDDVDDCCRKHDRCYDEKGYFSRSCDRKLCKCLRSKIDRKTKKGRAAALIYSYYSLGKSDMT